MKSLLFLVYCIEILGVLLCGVNTEITSGDSGSEDDFEASSDINTTTSLTTNPVKHEALTTGSLFSSGTKPTPHPQLPMTTSTQAPIGQFFKRECFAVYLLAAILIIVCFILLVSTLMLTCKVWQLSRHIERLSNSSDLISNSGYWMGTAKKNKNMSDTEAKETTELMADLSKTQENTTDATTKEGRNADGDEEKVVGDEKKEGDAANTEEASAGENKKETEMPAENFGSLKPEEETSDNKSTEAETVSSTKEPQDGE
ncbi:uncharacterized protein LOC115054650 [Echeneis naucrates]|uniref:uncharacterized protein LOC115054650 n=1 Tax=Echeneis naucrates TaxID=173247 RepID=UPI001114040C|nr:uncharacterized protein LOC115054650 [Echeneis naucrates]